jgi:hypothetical protein
MQLMQGRPRGFESDILPIKLRPFALDPFCPLSESKKFQRNLNARAMGKGTETEFTYWF